VITPAAAGFGPAAVRVARTMTDTPDQVRTRSEPLPEERAVETGGEDRGAEAAAILAESEERVAGAAEGRSPGAAADEHRTSADTAD
jgi:hypothetical protein